VAENYSGFLTNVGFAPLLRDVAHLKRDLAADGRQNQAALVQAAFDSFVAALQKIARETAVYAEQAVKDAEVGSQVRGHGGQGPSMTDFIGRSASIPDIPGTVGINDEDYLDANGVDWWWTNEEGFAGHIGREIVGFFTPSFTKPQAGGSGDTSFLPRKKGGVGIIEEPIPARYFVREGFDDAKRVWHSRIQAAEADFVAALRSAVRPGTPGVRP
jgi:hypothetical protein